MNSTGNSGQNGTLTATGVTAQTNSVVVAFFGVKKTTTLSTPTGMTFRYSQQNPQDTTILASDQTVSAGATGNKTSTAGAEEKWIAQLVELRVAVTAAPEMGVSGNSVAITSGDTEPSTADHTDFGGVAVSSGTVVRTFTIHNTGTGNLSISSVGVNGTHASDFSITTPPASSVAAGGNTTFQVTFDPSAAGLRTANVTIANNDSNENPYTFAIQGTGTVPEIDIRGNSVVITSGDTEPSTTDHTDFGSIDVSSGTVMRTFTIDNIGLAALTLTGMPIVTLGGANAGDFSVTTFPASSVPAGESTTFQITFDPSAAGLRTAIVSIANNDSDENPYTFAIRGYGIDRLLPTTHLIQQSASQSCSAGTTPYVRHCTVTFTLLNSSGGPLQISYYRITSISSHVFVLNGTPSPGQVGTIVSGVGGVAAGNTFQAQFNLGLTTLTAYSIRFNVYGYPDSVAAAGAVGVQPVALGEFEVTLQLDESVNSYRILLPVVQR